MNSWVENILFALSAFFGVTQFPAERDAWEMVTPWTKEDSGYYQMEARSREVGGYCRNNPESYLNFPMIIHSASQIYVDDTLVAEEGDPMFNSTSGFFGGMSVSCSILKGAQKYVTWKSYSYSHYFARFSHYPSFTERKSSKTFFYRTMPIIGAGAILLLCLLSILIFYKKISNAKLYSLVLSNLLTSIYFMGTVSSDFGFHLNMISAHKIADIGLWSGFIFFINLLFLEGLIPKFANRIVQISCSIAIVLILFASNGDMIQFGTTIPFVPVLGVTCYAFFNLISDREKTRKSMHQIFSLGFFLAACFNDVFMTLGVFTLMPILPLGMIGSYSFILFSVNEEILLAYTQRDELRRLTEDLKRSNLELKKAQALVVHKSKLEGLGTLAAGIAHEINNPLNHVYSFLKPLGKLCRDLEGANKKKVDKALVAMKECLEMTFSIIQSLKSFSGLNHAEISEVNFLRLVTSILIILKHKLCDVKVVVEIPETLVAIGNSVSINQVLMNLVTNARDAISTKPNGRIVIRALEGRESISLEVDDNGCGICDDIKSRIFDPFFTTKEIGEGMGLGLHICQGELKKYGGDIAIREKSGEGSCFVVTVPKCFRPGVAT